MKRMSGATREVWLVGPWAFKVPLYRHGWAAFLRGLLANMQERAFGAAHWPLCCPVLLAAPLGLLIVMPRCQPLGRSLTKAEWREFRRERVPVERKDDSFGLLAGRIVAVDYGGWARV